MEVVFALVYLGGMIISIPVQRHRAEVPQIGRLGMATMFSSTWFMVSIAKAFVWPIVLAVWLAQGRPESPWQMRGEKVHRVEPGTRRG